MFQFHFKFNSISKSIQSQFPSGGAGFVSVNTRDCVMGDLCCVGDVVGVGGEVGVQHRSLFPFFCGAGVLKPKS